MYQLKEPSKKISKNAIKVWRIIDFINLFISFSVLTVLLVLSNYYSWSEWVDWLIYSLMGILIASAVVELTLIPIYKQKTWRYEIDIHMIQLKHGGIFRRKHLIIPMNKVYFVDTYQGPLLKKFELSSIKIGTIGYVHEIPCLPEKEASDIRNYIAYITENQSKKIELRKDNSL
ncbi:PH domain-containing protein [Bacillus safensis]|uniref:PH domain-containing protein n=1 Tax=Bacillus safensis TaxID=561879 RepID=UPI000B439946|nr:PH domain-containing protein [Bacillus safensis]PAK32503.1 hypothetical protein CHI04_18915 [Bacillus safensis]UDB51950.1 PH domain-containing protein [Bacillus safensis]